MIDGKGGILPPFLTLQSIKKGWICNGKNGSTYGRCGKRLG